MAREGGVATGDTDPQSSDRNGDDMAELEPAAITISTRGAVPPEATDYARQKVAAAATPVSDPVLYAEVELRQEATAARPSVAEATLDVNGKPVRAQVAAAEMNEAIDLLADVLTRRLRRYQERANREGRERYRFSEAAEGEWRHGDLPTQRPEYFDRPYDERELVRTKSFGSIPTLLDEAVLDMDMLGHDFYLFRDATTGSDAVVFYKGGGTSLGVQLPEGVEGDPTEDAVAEVELVAPAPRLSRRDAIERLEASNEKFVFFIDEATGRGSVVYRRYDGHWGLLTTHD